VIFTLSEIAEACRARLLDPPTGDGPDVRTAVVDGVSIDSRSLRPGELFVPIVAERDGHDFVASAVAGGAAAYLTARPGLTPAVVGGGVGLLVTDTAEALSALGAAARRRLPDRVVAVTGSVGKTSVKDLTAAALGRSFVTAASLRSFNNELGVPLTLANSPDGTTAAVIEMGARGEGHVASLCAVARPTIGIVTRVAPAHLELFGSVDAVARAKGELVEALPAGPLGVAVLNADDPRVLAMAARTRADVLTYGAAGDLRAEDVRLDATARARFTAVTPWGQGTVALPIAGAHMVGNALAALAAAVAAGAPLDAAIAGITAATLSPWRMEVVTAANGATVLNDAYNASPVAVRAAFEALLALGPPGRGRRLAVLGGMAELGESAGDAHRELAELASTHGIELFSVATDLYGVDDDHRFAGIDEARRGLAALGLGPDDVVLVKASRVVGLERLAAALCRRAGEDDGVAGRS